MIVDLQVAFDGDASKILEGAKAAGLDGVVLTGPEGRFAATQNLKQNDAGVTVFAGAKLPTNHGLLLALLPDPSVKLSDDWAPKGEDGLYDADAVIEAIEEMGGVTVALRPYDRELAHPMGDSIFGLHGISACDVQNGRCSPAANGLALEAASNLELPCVGTSSAEGTEGLGTSATLFRGPIKSEIELIEAIRHGECWPVAFSSTAPRGEAPRGRQGGGGRGDRSDGGGDRSDRGGDRSDRGGERSDRGGDRSDRGGDRSDRGRRGGGRRGGGRGRGPGGGGMATDSAPREDRGGGGGGGGGGSGAGGRGGRRGGGGGGGGRPQGGRRGPVSEDAGNRVRAPRNPVDEDIGNRIRSTRDREMPEDIGNRLRPGETPLWKKGPDDEE